MSKFIPQIVFGIQLIATIFFAIFAADLPQDNSIDNFAVKSQNAQKNYDILLKAFDSTESFLISIELKSTQTFARQTSLVEDLYQRISGETGIYKYHSLTTDIPETLITQLTEELGSQHIAKELPFPFLADGTRFYTAVFQLGDLNSLEREELISRVLQKIEFFKFSNQDWLEDIVVYGEPIVNYYLGQSSLEVKYYFFPALAIFCLILIASIFRSFKVLAVWLLALGSAFAITMGIFRLSGNSLNLITNLISIIVFVLSTAMHMHILLSLTKYNEIDEGLKEKLIPNFLVTLTTSIGFGSLMTSEVAPIALLGKYACIAIWLIFLCCYATHLGFSKLIHLQLTNIHLPAQDSLISKFDKFAKASGWFILIPIATIIGAIYIVLHNPLESNGLKYFNHNHPVRQNTHLMEKSITGSNYIELLIPHNQQQAVLTFDFYQKTAVFERKLSKLEGLRHIISIHSQLQLVRKSVVGFDQYDKDSLVFRSAEVFNTTRDEVKESVGFSHLLSREYYRIQINCNSLDSEQFNHLKKQIYKIYEEAKLEGQLIITGPLDRVIEIQNYLLSSLSSSLLLTVVLALGLMSLFLRNWEILYLSLIPNLFPLGCIGLSLYLCGFPTTIATVMVFSIAFGIAVDSTIHLFHSFYIKDGSFAERWQWSLTMNASAIFITSILLTGGFWLIGILSGFLPTIQFGILLCIGMVTAFIGDVTFLPISLRIRENLPWIKS